MFGRFPLRPRRRVRTEAVWWRCRPGRRPKRQRVRPEQARTDRRAVHQPDGSPGAPRRTPDKPGSVVPPSPLGEPGSSSATTDATGPGPAVLYETRPTESATWSPPDRAMTARTPPRASRQHPRASERCPPSLTHRPARPHPPNPSRDRTTRPADCPTRPHLGRGRAALWWATAAGRPSWRSGRNTRGGGGGADAMLVYWDGAGNRDGQPTGRSGRGPHQGGLVETGEDSRWSTSRWPGLRSRGDGPGRVPLPGQVGLYYRPWSTTSCSAADQDVREAGRGGSAAADLNRGWPRPTRGGGPDPASKLRRKAGIG